MCTACANSSLFLLLTSGFTYGTCIASTDCTNVAILAADSGGLGNICNATCSFLKGKIYNLLNLKK